VSETVVVTAGRQSTLDLFEQHFTLLTGPGGLA
jgi:hypothetical protein